MDSQTTHAARSSLSTNLRELARLLNHRRAVLTQHNPRLAPWFLDLAVPQGPEWARQVPSLPFLSIRAFKHERVSTVDPGQPGNRTFMSSGSTGSRRGQHVVGEQALASYAAASHRALQKALTARGLSGDAPVYSLVPPPNEWPDSSLAAMIAMWKDCGHTVRYVSPADIPRETIRAWSSGCGALVVFGTTAHHLQVRQSALQAALNGAAHVRPGPQQKRQEGRASQRPMALIFDTGGTKGRTDTATPAEQCGVLRGIYTDLFGPHVDVDTASEYGMSELCSQAWSEPGPSLRDFLCADGLRVATVSPELDRLCALGSHGFLAFVDERNTDSYPAIITEDCGWSRPAAAPDGDRQTHHWLASAFTLEGRAPLASAKGCSLRVFGQIPQPIESERTTTPDQLPPRARSQDQSKHLPDFPAALFTPSERHDLRAAWESALAALRSCSRQSHAEETQLRPTGCSDHAGKTTSRTLEIVASANVCVTFLYPLYAAAITGYTHARIFLPSNRDDDPLAAHVRAQIDWLIGELQQALPLAIEVLPSSAGLFARRRVDTAVVFGTDDTVSLFRDHYKETNARFLGFGQTQNCAILPDLQVETAARAAEDCLVWKGRGCLTPLVVYVPEGEPAALSGFVDEFCTRLRSAFEREHQGCSDLCIWFHRHDLVAIRATIINHIQETAATTKAEADAESLVDRALVCGPGWAVIPLLEVPRPQELAKRLDFGCAGQGLVFLAPLACSQAPGWPTQEQSSRPAFSSPHFGKTWIDWLAAKDMC